jgi:alkylation response protein AidB-like acyl-CoA dehydrogenase
VDHEVLDRIADIEPYLRSQADTAESLRRLPDETAKKLNETGVVRLLQPKRWNGYEAEPQIFFEAVMRIASNCGASGWVAGVAGVHPWELASFEDKAQDEVWGEDTDTWVSSSYQPGGTGQAVSGGYVLSGRWMFSSGSDHCRWVILGGFVQDEPGGPKRSVHFLLPRKDYEIEDNWHVVGLAGTGSNDIVVNEVFVPEHRVISRDAVHDATGPGLSRNTAPVFRIPWGAIFPNAIAASVIGISMGALGAHMDYQRSRVAQTTGAVIDNPLAMDAIGQAAGEIEVSRDQMMRNVETLYGYLVRGEEIPLAVRVRNRRDQVQGVWRTVRAVDDIFARSGGNALRKGNPIQRFWRDAHAGLNHVVNVPDKAFHSWAAVEMGLDPVDNVL